MANRYTFRWEGSDVAILTLPSLNVQRHVRNAKAAYMNGDQVVVIGSCNEVITY